MSNYPDPSNPYYSPAQGYLGQTPSMYPPPAPRRGLPVLCLAVFIMDLVFCVIRVPLVGFGIVGLQMAPNDPMVVQTGIFEVLAGVGIVVCGIPGNIAMLAKQKWGVVLGWATVAATIASVCVGLWQMTFFLEQHAPGTLEYVGAIMGGVIVLGLRLSLLGLYVAALLWFARWEPPRVGAMEAQFPVR